VWVKIWVCKPFWRLNGSSHHCSAFKMVRNRSNVGFWVFGGHVRSGYGHLRHRGKPLGFPGLRIQVWVKIWAILAWLWELSSKSDELDLAPKDCKAIPSFIAVI